MRILRFLLACGSAAALTSGLAITGGATAGLAATREQAAHHQAHHLSPRFLAEARKSLIKYLGAHPLAIRVHPAGHRAPRGSATMDSFNWSGYVDQASGGQSFGKVSGKWNVPQVTCTAEDTLATEWVGLDGWSSRTVEQDGTVGWCFEGTPTYYTWWEMYPANQVEVSAGVQYGDAISASVSRSGSAFTLAVTDSTHGASSFTRTARCVSQCLASSAEWIAERPAFSIGIAPLADYHTWTVTDAQETYRGIPGTISSPPGYVPVDMQDATQSYLLSTAGALSGGTSFTTTWDNSY